MADATLGVANYISSIYRCDREYPYGRQPLRAHIYAYEKFPHGGRVEPITQQYMRPAMRIITDHLMAVHARMIIPFIIHTKRNTQTAQHLPSIMGRLLNTTICNQQEIRITRRGSRDSDDLHRNQGSFSWILVSLRTDFEQNDLLYSYPRRRSKSLANI